MNNTLTIRLTSQPEQPLEWLHWPDGALTPTPGSGQLTDISQLDAVKSVILLLPSDQVNFATADVPSKSTQQIKLAASSLMEEHLVNDVDDNHLVICRGDYPKVFFAAIDKTFLAQTLVAFNEVGIQPDYALPDCLALPMTDHGWTVYENNNQLLIRHDRFAGIQLEKSWLTEDIRNGHGIDLSALSEQPPQTITIYIDEAQSDESLAATLSDNIADCDVQTIKLQPHQNILNLYADSGTPDSELNFLIGEFKPTHRRDHSWINWHLPIYAAAASLLITSFALLLQGMSLESQHDELRQQVDTHFRQTVPNVTTIVDYRLQFEREINRLKQSSGTSARAIADLYEILSRIQSANQLSLINLSIADKRITLDLNAPDLESAKRFMSSLDDSKLYQSQLMSAQNNGGSTRIRIRISPVAS